MLRQLRDMPLGTHGFEAIGEVDDDDWARTVEPVLRQEIAEGRTLRLLYVFGPATMDVDDDALKAGAGFRARHVTSFERVAVVSDVRVGITKSVHLPWRFLADGSPFVSVKIKSATALAPKSAAPSVNK